MSPRSRKNSLPFRAFLSLLGFGTAVLSTLVHWGCHSNTGPSAPVAPARGYSLSFTLPLNNEVKASLLNVASNEVLYEVTGPDMQPVTGLAGPFPTNSAVGAGELDFPLAVPQGSSRLMAFQLNDASNHQPLALGAAESDINAGGVSDIFVTMGSVVRSCYVVDTSSFFPPGPNSSGVSNVYFTFMSDSLSSTGGDMAVTSVSGGFDFTAQASNQIAYMGNGPLVKFAAEPGTPAFYHSASLAKQAAGVSPSTLQSNDVYCVSLGAAGANGHAWVQVINPNEYFGFNLPIPIGPKFRFRFNQTLPYFAYDETTADLNNACPPPIATPTTDPTNTPTATNSPTNTVSPTSTNTPPPTNTFTATFSPTATNSPAPPTSTSTPTNSLTPTLSPTITLTPLPPTSTGTATSTRTPTNSPSYTPTGQPTSTSTSTSSPSLTATLTGTPTKSGTPTATGTSTLSPTYTPTGQPTPTLTPTNAATSTGTSTATSTVTSSPTASTTATPTGTPTFSATNTSTATSTATLTPTNTTTSTGTSTNTPTGTLTPVLTSTPTDSTTATPTSSPTLTATASPSPTQTVTPSNSATNSPTVSPTGTPTLSPTSTWTLTPLPTPSLGSAAVSCVNAGTGGSCRVFQLSIVANGPTGFSSQSYATVKDVTNGNAVTVGPWYYAGAGTTFTTNLSGESFGVTSTTVPAPATLSLALLDSTLGVTFGTLAPAGSPLSLEAPLGYLYTVGDSCATPLEDGNCSVFNLTFSAYTPACAATQVSMARVTNLSNGASTMVGPVTYTCNGFTYAVPAEAMGVTVGQQALNQQLKVDLYDSTGTVVWDSKPLNPLNLEFPGNSIASSSMGCITTNTSDSSCQAFAVTINANGPSGVGSTSYAYVIDLQNSVSVLVGPWNYSGTGMGFSVTLLPEDFNVTTPNLPVSTNFAIKLLDETQGKVLDTSNPSGSPLTIEAPPVHVYNNSFSCTTPAQDGNCEYFTFTTTLNNPAASPVTSLVKLTDVNSGNSVFIGPVVSAGPGNTGYSVTLTGALLNLLPGQTAVNHAFQEELTDPSGVTVLDSVSAGTFSYEYGTTNYLAGSSLGCVMTGAGGACQAIAVTINANGPASLSSTGMALLTDTQNGNTLWLGPWTYTGSGESFSVTVLSDDLGLLSANPATLTGFTLKLYDGTGTVLEDSDVPTGSPLTLVYPTEYIRSSSFSCSTTAEDGNCTYFTFNPQLDNPGSTPVTSQVWLIDQTNPATVVAGPFVNNGGGNAGYSVTLNGAQSQFGLAPGQSAVSHVFMAQLYDAGGVTLLDSTPVGTFSYEYPSDYLTGASLAPLFIDGTHANAVQAFVLNLNTQGPPGISSSNYALVTDTANSNSTTVGPWTYTGAGSLSVTLKGSDFSLTNSSSGQVSTGFTVKLLDNTRAFVLDTAVPTGSPITFEAPQEFIYGSSYNFFSCATTAEDGNCVYFTYHTDLDAPFSNTLPVTTLVKLTDTNSGAFVTLGPFVSNNGANAQYSVTLNSSSFGVTTPGQSAVSHVFFEQLYDASGVTLLDQSGINAPFSYEYPTNYISAASVSVLSTDSAHANAVQQFVLKVTANGPAGVTSSNTALVTDTQNNATTLLGPWTYTGAGSLSVTLNGTYFGLTNSSQGQLPTGFTVKLFDGNGTYWLDTFTPTGSPITLEAPQEFIYGSGYNFFSCASTAEDGNCVYFTYHTDLDAPFSNTTPVTTLVKLTDTTNGAIVTLGPFVSNNGGNAQYSVTMNSSSFGVTLPGQSAVSHVFFEQLYDASGVTLLDQSGINAPFSYEYPTNYISAASVSVLSTDSLNGAVQRFVLKVTANGPAGVASANTALVTDTQNNATTLLGPWNYTGSGTLSVTLNGTYFGLVNSSQGQLPTGFTVKLFDGSGTYWLDTFTPTGSPITFEAPQEFIYGSGYNFFSCATTAEDGNCTYFTYKTDLDAPFGATTPVTTLVKLADTTSGALVTLGPFVNNGGNVQYAVTLNSSSFGVTLPGQSAVSHVFFEQLYDAGGVTLLDQSGINTPFSYEYPANYIASSSVGCVVTDSGNNSCQAFGVTINANGPSGVNSTNFALVTDLQNNATAWVGPWTYSGSSSSFSVTLYPDDFSVSGAVSSNLKIQLYDETQTHVLDTSIPTGSPITLEQPSVYIYSNGFSNPTYAEDGNAVTFVFNTTLYNTGAPSTSSAVSLVDLSASPQPVTLYVGTFINATTGNQAFAVTLNGANFGLAAGQAAVSQQFEELLYNSAGTTLLDAQPVTVYNIENNSPANTSSLTSSSVTPLLGPATACQSFVLTFNTAASSAVTTTNFAAVTDLSNGRATTLGPFTYSGLTASIAVTVKASDLNVTTSAPVSSAFVVNLLNGNATTVLGSATPTGSPLTLVGPIQWFTSPPSLSCNTTAEDGYCQAFTFGTYMQSPSGTVTTYVKLVDTNASGGPITVGFGPLVDSGGGGYSTSYNLLAQQFGLNTLGQQAANQNFVELLYADAAGVTLLDSRPVSVFNLEAPTAFLASASVGCVQSDPSTGGCQQFAVTLNANGPTGIPKTSYARMTDLSNNNVVTLGPFNYTGTGGSYAATLKGSDFLLNTAGATILTNFAVTLFDGSNQQEFNWVTVGGAPITLEAPVQRITSSGVACAVTALDGNCNTFTFSNYLTSPSGPTVTTYIRLADLNAPGGPITLNMGPVTDSGGGGYSNTYTLLAQQFGLTSLGQVANGQQFEELLYADAGATTLLDTKMLGSLNLEAPTAFLASASVGCVQSDPSTGGCQQFSVTLNANGPTGIPKTSYARMTDLSNNNVVTLGPFNYTGTGGSYAATLKGSDFLLNTAGATVLTNFAVTLFDGSNQQEFNWVTVGGAPITLEAPVQRITASANVGCAVTALDGNCNTFIFSNYLTSPSGPTVTTYIRLADLNAPGGPITLNMGPVTDTSGGSYSNSYTLLAQQFGLTSLGQVANGQQFEELLYADAGATTLLDTRMLGTLNLEAPTAFLASASVGCVQSDPSTGGCQQFAVTLNANGPTGIPKTSYARMTDLSNNNVVTLGPFNYTGTGGSYAATLKGSDFLLNTAGVTALSNFAVTLFDGTDTQEFNWVTVGGAPITLEAPVQRITASANVGCAVTALDGNCNTFTFSNYVISPSGPTVTTYVKLVDTNASGGPITVNMGPITDTNGGSYSNSYTLLAQQFGLTSLGQVANGQQFEELLYADAGSVTLLDSRMLGTLNLEAPTAFLASASLGCVQSDLATGACQQFAVTLNVNGPTGIPKTSYARMTDLANNNVVTLGPINYTGTGGSYAATLRGSDFGVLTQGITALSNFAVTLFDGTDTQEFNSVTVGGAPITFEAPLAYLTNYAIGCGTTAQDGNCEAVTLYTYVRVPGSNTVATRLKLVDISASGGPITVDLGPVTNANGGNYSYAFGFGPGQFGVTLAGQQALGQTFVEQLYDSTGVTLLDSKSPGALNLENPSPFLTGTTLTCLTSDSGNGACQAFQLTLNAKGPNGVPETTHALVVNASNGAQTQVDPWSFTGTGSTSVTISGKDLGLSTSGLPVSTSLSVTLLNAQNQMLGVSFPTGGSPVTLETPPAYIYTTGFSAPVPAEDGNWNGFTFTVYAYTPSCAATQVSLVRLVDTTNGSAVTLGPVTYTCSSFSWGLNAAQFGLLPGQSAVSQAFVAQIYDSTGTHVWDTQPVATVNLEYPPTYISSSTAACLTTDPGNGACQAFQVTTNASGPAGVTQAVYTQVWDTTKGTYVSAGPWGFIGSGSNTVTVSAYDLGISNPGTPVPSQIGVTLYNGSQNQILSSSVPTGAAITLEEPPAYIYSPSLTVLTTAGDGNCKTFSLSLYAYSPSCAATLASQVRLVDLSNGNAVTLGTVADTCSYYSWNLSASQFGLAPGQAAVSQVFQAQFFDPTGAQIWDVRSPGTLSLEGQ